MYSEDEQQWIEWGVRRTWGAVGTVAYFERDRRTAEKCAKDWPGVLVSRVVQAGDWTTATAADEPGRATQEEA